MSDFNDAWRDLGHAIYKELKASPIIGLFFRWYFGLLARLGQRKDAE